jgi:hypothetical protein
MKFFMSFTLLDDIIVPIQGTETSDDAWRVLKEVAVRTGRRYKSNN